MSLEEELKSFKALPEKITSDLEGSFVISHPKEEIVSAAGPDYLYQIWFRTPELDAKTIKRIHSVQLVAESHDQGFCDNEDNGCWTWFELCIMENATATEPRVKDGIELNWISHNNRLKTHEYGWKTGKEFKKNHDMFRLLEEGNVIAVRLCARFQRWELWAKNGNLVITLGDEVKRSPLDYGPLASNINGLSEVFQDINNTILKGSLQLGGVKQGVFQAEMINSSDGRPLRVLSLDGGGVRGIAALKLLKAIMEKGAPGKKPCEVFDMIGGTSTGGFIAIMLGRLKMSVDDCLAKYIEFMGIVFPKKYTITKYIGVAGWGQKWDAKPLEDCIKKLIKDTLHVNDPENVQLMDDVSQKDSCKVFVMAVNSVGANNHAPVLFRSYINPLEQSVLPSIKLWQAARATSAAPMYFKPLEVNGYSFVDGGLQANNPLGWLWNEVLSVHGPARTTNTFLSIGTGMPESQVLGGVHSPVALVSGVIGTTTNSEVTNILFRSLLNAFAPQGMAKKYWRFNVGDGLPDWVEEDGTWKWKLTAQRKEEALGELDDTKMIEVTKKKADEYLALPGAKVMIEECGKSLQ